MEMTSNNDVESLMLPNGVRSKLMATLAPPPVTGGLDSSGSVRRSHLDLTGGREGFLHYLPWWCFQKKFVHEDVEKLYQEYYHKQKQRDTVWVFVAAAIFTAYALCLQWISDPLEWTDKRIVLIFCCLINIVAVLFFFFLELRISENVWALVPFLAWSLFYAEVFMDTVIGDRITVWTDVLGWTLVLVYIIYVLLPLRMYSCIVLSLVTSVTHIVLIALSLPSKPSSLILQVMANVLLLVGANLLGAMSHVFTDKKHRKSYLETRTAMRVKLELEERTREQERLLLSVLPEHVAEQIRKDIGEVVDGQFKKIYMSRHENVSILFADIVGFTAISSTYSAADLVQILNELFARFDKLAEKFHQLRIKILGDCYYCISGAPQERSDHAVLCVHMGLSMVDAIKYVREKTKSPVDMRVGIHTGAVLAGIFGQRQWQFDVYSKDVELANKMESGGKPGRVHISEKTFAYLNGEFDVEPGDGSSRDETIKSSGLKTYFIVKILKPYPNGTLDKGSGHILENVLEETTTVDESVKEETKMLEDAKQSEENYRKRLFQEQEMRGRKRHLYKTCNPVTLRFKQKQMEEEYNSQMANPVDEATASAPIVALLGTLAQMLVLPRTVASYLTLCFGNILILVLSLISISPAFPKRIPQSITHLGKNINESFIKRHLWIFFIIIILILVNVLNMVFCDSSSATVLNAVNGTVSTTTTSTVNFNKLCVNPQYFTGYSVLVLLTITVLLHVSYLMKLGLIAAITALQTYANVFCLDVSFAMSDDLTGFGPELSTAISRKYSLSAMLGSIGLALLFINRHMEAATRLLFKWKKEVEEQKGQVDQIMHKTVTLVYNILPQHVANVFLKSNMRHDELYSQSYTEVGVLFASMPNFSDFYTEESVNNQGLECLRFLNEVISDFDALLEQERFFDIIKIKTTGATYMAASGLNDKLTFESDASVREKWAHLDRLTQFALALKETLHNINDQSFNNFILRMGINHGPIIAGVIGARKPHYDMWGNTVNVASRMESTGKAGCIQVVEETANILKEFGYEFEQRGMVQVKGKGHLMTYYLIGRNQGSPSTSTKQ